MFSNWISGVFFFLSWKQVLSFGLRWKEWLGNGLRTYFGGNGSFINIPWTFTSVYHNEKLFNYRICTQARSKPRVFQRIWRQICQAGGRWRIPLCTTWFLQYQIQCIASRKTYFKTVFLSWFWASWLYNILCNWDLSSFSVVHAACLRFCSRALIPIYTLNDFECKDSVAWNVETTGIDEQPCFPGNVKLEVGHIVFFR